MEITEEHASVAHSENTAGNLIKPSHDELVVNRHDRRNFGKKATVITVPTVQTKKIYICEITWSI